jgi:hypothetical protein
MANNHPAASKASPRATYTLTLQADRCNPETVLTYHIVGQFTDAVRTFLVGHRVIETGPFHCTLRSIDTRGRP